MGRSPPAGTQDAHVSTDNAFLELIDQMRRGDHAAAAELVRRYEPAIRRAVRLQMRDPRLRRVLDSVDVCQSVMASFFARAASGQYDLADPRQLSRLLLVMARNKLAAQARHPRVKRREPTPPAGVLRELVAPGPSASHLVDWLDLFEAVRGHLSEEELYLADRRAEGQEWAQIAAGLGIHPDAVRKKLARALQRVGRELGLDDPHGD
jgi:RNA polymerase sigma-70 factor (ECF subfamily)